MKNTLRLSLVAAVSLFALEASAGGFAVRQQSVTSQGAAYAGTGTGAGGISGMFWNPAAVTTKEGRNSEWNFSYINANSSLTPTVGTGVLNGTAPGSGNTAIGALVPASYNNLQINEQIWLGLSNTAPFGSRTKPNDYWAGQIYGRSSKLRNINVTPTVGYKPFDWLSLGFGVQVSYLDVALNRVIPTAATPAGLAAAAGTTAPTSQLAGDGFGLGYTLGFTVRPTTATEIGVGFRSSIRHNLDGNLRSPGGITPINAVLNLPEMLTVGLSHQFTNDFKGLASVEWTNWSRAKTAPVTVGGIGTPVTGIHFRYQDGWLFSLGGEYKLNQQLTMRAGLAYEISPITDNVRQVAILDNNRLWASIGATYQWNEKLSIDAAYTHIFIKDPNTRINAANPAFLNAAVDLVATGKASADLFSIALKYRWDTPPARLADVPVVRKG